MFDHINTVEPDCGVNPQRRSRGLRDVARNEKYLHALRAVARGEVFHTDNSTEFKITGPCSRILLWSLWRMELIADPPGGPVQGRHAMVLTATGVETLQAALGSDLRALGRRLATLKVR